MGSHSKLAWGPLAAGYGKSVDEWKYFESIPHREQNDYLSQIRGGHIMASEIRLTLLSQTEPEEQINQTGWFGCFSDEGNCEAVKSVDANGSASYFEVDRKGRLGRSRTETTEDVTQAYWCRIRMLANIKGKWCIDPKIDNTLELVKAWIYGNRPLVGLPWDPGDYTWQIPQDHHLAAQQKTFFEYTVKLGRKILAGARNYEPAATRVWEEYGIPDDTINYFWNRIWKQKHTRKISTFQWLVVHRGLAVGAWYKGSVGEKGCLRCGDGLETQQHCLWECSQAQAIWKRILRVMARAGMEIWC